VQETQRRRLREEYESNERDLWQKLCVFSSNEKQTHDDATAIRYNSKQNGTHNPAVDLLVWFLDHCEHPFPLPDQTNELVQKTGLSRVQVSNWFTNTRKVGFQFYWTLKFDEIEFDIAHA
jgi:hypothetical protein